jgi:large subunit ribosomal protein L23
MGLFTKDTKKETKTKAIVPAKAKTVAVKKEKKVATPVKDVAMKRLPKDASGKLFEVIRAPWLSEKALIQTEKGVYVFEIPADATKKDVMLAIQKSYNVAPRKVNVVNLPGKRKKLKKRRGFGTRAGVRKAYVYLKKGETIAIA